MSAPVTPIDALLGPPIAALNQAVFFKVSLLGVQVEGLILVLAAAMLFFTVWLGAPQFRLFRHAVDVVRGRYADPTAPGAGSHFAALSTALSGTVGLGNVAGVAIAIGVGGPGAAFWMFVIGGFAMALKMAEVTLGMKYRIADANGETFGGPMYTIARGFARRPRLKTVGLALGGFYAVAALGGALPLLQSNQSFEQIAAVSGLRDWLGEGGARWAYGLVLAALVAVVVLGSARWLGQVTSRLVPAMCVLYAASALVVLVLNAPALPGALALIFSSAFTTDAAYGGAIGAFVVGMRRAVYSCEAGVGSSVMAHTLAKTKEPVSEGVVALLEPFIDTVVVCSLTALVIVVTGAYALDMEGVAMTSAAFAGVVSWFPYVLAATVLLLAYSTLISWGYYGTQAWGFLFGRSRASILTYKVLYCLLVPLGAVLPLGVVVDFIDACFFLMAVPNIIGLAVLAGELRGDVRAYVTKLEGSNNRSNPVRFPGGA
jgi:alanine or glycine:cation symporter, AGCS family